MDHSIILQQLEAVGASQETIALAQGILLGDKSQFTPEMLQSFRTAGMSHLLAVSGLHVGIIMSLVWLLFKPVEYLVLLLPMVPKLGLLVGSPKTYYAFGSVLRLIVISITCLYVYAIGAPASAVRAALMLSLCLIGWMLHRPSSAVRCLLFAALLILAWDPWQVTQVGFQLSFLSVGGILICQPWINDHERSWFYRAILLSLSAQVFTLPVVAYYFHQLPFLGWLQGILVLPLMPVFVTLLLLLLCFPAFSWLLLSVEALQLWMSSVAKVIGLAEEALLGGHLYFYPSWWEVLLAEIFLLSVVALFRFNYKSKDTTSTLQS